MINMLGAVDRFSSRIKRLSSLPQLDTSSKLHEASHPPPPGPLPARSESPSSIYETSPSIDGPPSRAAPAPPASPATPQHSHTSSSGASAALQTPTPTTPQSQTLYETPTSVPSNPGSLKGSQSQTDLLAPPPALKCVTTTIIGGQQASTPPIITSRPNSYHPEETMKTTPNRRKSWLPPILNKVVKSRHTSQDLATSDLEAWVNAGEAKIEYDCNLLRDGERVRDLNLALHLRFHATWTT